MRVFNLHSLFIASALCMAGTACQVEREIRSPHWGKTSCAECRMAITVREHSAQLVGPGPRVRYYDDLGCLMADWQSDPALAEGRPYVVARGRGVTWKPADALRFAAGERTPMDYGFAPAVDGPLSFTEVVKRMRAEYGDRWQLDDPKSGLEHHAHPDDPSEERGTK